MEKDKELYKQARDHVQAMKGFYIHLFTFLLVLIGLAVINVMTDSSYLWFIWVFFGWGIGIVAHFVGVFGFGTLFNKDWEERKIKEYVKKGSR